MPARLGQHWLTDQASLAAMVQAAGVRPGQLVLEIGPGQGALTDHLLQAGALVTAVELDQGAVPAVGCQVPGH